MSDEQERWIYRPRPQSFSCRTRNQSEEKNKITFSQRFFEYTMIVEISSDHVTDKKRNWTNWSFIITFRSLKWKRYYIYVRFLFEFLKWRISLMCDFLLSENQILNMKSRTKSKCKRISFSIVWVQWLTESFFFNFQSG